MSNQVPCKTIGILSLIHKYTLQNNWDTFTNTQVHIHVQMKWSLVLQLMCA